MRKISLLFFLLSSTCIYSQLALDISYANAGINDTGLQSYNTYSGSDGVGISNAPYFLPDNTILIPYAINPFYSAQFPNLAPTIGIKKYLENGNLDTSFGTNGTALFTANFHADRFDISGITMQPDGKIILVGRTHQLGLFSRDYQVFICRFNANGTKDTSFGTSGITKLNLYVENSADTNDERFVDVTVDDQNRIIAVGYTYWYLGSSIYDSSATAVRFLSNGTVDTSFATNGKFQMSLTGQDSFCNIYKSGNSLILLGNTNPTLSQSDFLVAKIDANGNLDTSFGTNGMAQVGFGGNVLAVKIFQEQDDKMMIAGLKLGSGMAFAKLNTDGSLDTAFSGDGKSTTSLAVPGHDPIGSEAYPGISSDHIERLPDNKYIIVSSVRVNNSYDYAITRLNIDTTKDTSFMSNGLYVNDIAAFDWARGLHVQTDGKLVVLVGSTLFRYLNFSVLDLDGVNALKYRAYPNPTSGVLNLDNIAQTAIITDFTGKTIATFNSIEKIDFSNYLNGIYFLTVTFEDGRIQVMKVIKQ
jgi:uncharacterized delta-60 repeat protein